MATHSCVLAWRIPGMGAWWAATYGVAQSRTRLKRLSSSSSPCLHPLFLSCSGPLFSNTCFHQQNTSRDPSLPSQGPHPGKLAYRRRPLLPGSLPCRGLPAPTPVSVRSFSHVWKCGWIMISPVHSALVFPAGFWVKSRPLTGVYHPVSWHLAHGALLPLTLLAADTLGLLLLLKRAKLVLWFAFPVGPAVTARGALDLGWLTSSRQLSHCPNDPSGRLPSPLPRSCSLELWGTSCSGRWGVLPAPQSGLGGTRWFGP